MFQTSFKVERESLQNTGWNLVNKEKTNLLKKIFDKGTPLLKYVDKKIFYGIKTGLNRAFVIDEETKNQLIKEDPSSANVIKPFLTGRDIKRYAYPEAAKFLILFPKGFTKKYMDNSRNAFGWLGKNYPAIAHFLKPLENKANNRYDKGDYWWELRACDYYDEFERSKIMLPDISLKGNFTLDIQGGFYCVNTAYIISSTEKYLLGILNSNLMNFCYTSISSSYRGGYLRYIYQYLARLPILKFELKNDSVIKIENLVDQMLTAKKQLQQAKTESDKNYLERKRETIDRQIDQLVYELYGLTEDEIKIVEDSIK